MINSSKLLLPALLAVSLSATPSHAVITALDFGSFMDTANIPTYTITSAQQHIADGDDAFSLAGAKSLVVTVGAEGDGGAKILNDVTYGGVSLTEAVTSGAQRYSAIYYLNLTGVTLSGSDLVFEWNGNTGGVAGSLFALDTEITVQPGNTSSVLSVSTALDVAAGSFVVAAINANNDGTPSLAATSELTDLAYATSGTNALSSRQATGYAQITSADPSYLIEFSSQTSPSLTAVEFTAIPEPSAALLGGMGALLLLRRRRH
ncbi:MAG: hypothetical protein ACO3SO_10265 [Luteolibacter sp.]